MLHVEVVRHQGLAVISDFIAAIKQVLIKRIEPIFGLLSYTFLFGFSASLAAVLKDNFVQLHLALQLGLVLKEHNF